MLIATDSPSLDYVHQVEAQVQYLSVYPKTETKQELIPRILLSNKMGHPSLKHLSSPIPER